MSLEKLSGVTPLSTTDPNGIISVPLEGHSRRSAHAVRFLVLLKTLGHPALHRANGALEESLRRKDLALLVYLCVEGLPVHARGRLAALLWGDSPEERARHSLTQALGRLSRALPPGTLSPDKDAVRWTGALPCDATSLRDGLEPDEVDDAFALYAGHFLEGFDPGAGAQDFREWADRRRAELRNAALRLLDRAGAHAESAGDFARALRLGERAVEIDPVWEQGHRRVMRALAARGERNGALRHYQRLESYLDEEVGGRPDPDTRALAEQLRAPASDAVPAPVPPSAPAPQAPAPRMESTPVQHPDPALSAPHAADEAAPTPAAVAPSAPEAAGAVDPRGDVETVTVMTVAGEPAPTEPETTRAADADRHPPVSGAPALAPGAAQDGRADDARLPFSLVMDRIALWLAVILASVVLGMGIALQVERRAAVPPATEAPPAHGEHVRLRGGHSVYLVFGERLYEYPDSSTLSVCTGWHPDVVREVRALPAWPSRRLPSVLRHAWVGGHLPIVSDHPQDRTAFVPVGCVIPGVPTPGTLDSIFGTGSVDRLLEVPDSVIRQLPRAFVARGHPLRPAGTLIRSPDGRVRWITYHGGSLDVPDPATLADYCRAADEAVPVSTREFAYYKPWSWLRPRERACAAG